MSRLTRIWKERQISSNTQMRLVQSLFFLYAAGMWTMLQRDRNRVRAFEMRCWRRLLRVPWTARRTDVSIPDELGIQVRLDDIVSHQILRYFGHIMRRENTLEKTIVEGKVWGRRPRGRSLSRWIDQGGEGGMSPVVSVVSINSMVPGVTSLGSHVSRRD